MPNLIAAAADVREEQVDAVARTLRDIRSGQAAYPMTDAEWAQAKAADPASYLVLRLDAADVLDVAELGL